MIESTYSFDNEAYGAVFGGGLNVTLSIDKTIGLRYSYYLGESDTWAVTDDDDNEYDDYILNTIYSGSAIMLQFIWAPKSLGFDPTQALNNLTE